MADAELLDLQRRLRAVAGPEPTRTTMHPVSRLEKVHGDGMVGGSGFVHFLLRNRDGTIDAVSP